MLTNMLYPTEQVKSILQQHQVQVILVVYDSHLGVS